ncbi:MAG: hypothetical protein NT040_01140 [Bacteroidetes bacterium]|nr:hypothetical protein [Bacteroidota bacterium]
MRFAVIIVLITIFSINGVKASNDSLTLAQAFVNLSLTCQYFDTLRPDRISKILRYEESELSSIRDTQFIRLNSKLYNFTKALWSLNKGKQTFRKDTVASRKTLLEWKDLFVESRERYFQTGVPVLIRNWASDYPNRLRYFEPGIDCLDLECNSFYEFIKFDTRSYYDFNDGLNQLAAVISPLFNRDIYPDFKRIFYSAKNSDTIYLDSLSWYAGLYHFRNAGYNQNMQLYRSDFQVEPADSGLFFMSSAPDLIKRYLYLLYIAREKRDHIDISRLYTEYRSFVSALDPADTLTFRYPDSVIKKDTFFNKEIGSVTCAALLQLLKKNYPEDTLDYIVNKSIRTDSPVPTKYVFPHPAPFPSAVAVVPHFHPGLKTMTDVDKFLRKNLDRAGYDGRCHYYYAADGFAITTSLEKIKRDGSQLPANERWNLSYGSDGKFSVYTIFKSMFFATDGSFRILAFVVSSQEAERTTTAPSFSAMSQLLKNSYAALPQDLEDSSLPDKALTTLVYNFYQSDIGEVPVLDTRQLLTVRDHFRNTHLMNLLTH